MRPQARSAGGPAHRFALRVAMVVVAIVLIPGGAVGADPPGPTDFETTVLAIDPQTPAVAVAVIGGDSFVQLTVERGTEVSIPGYLGEPYLRFNADGSVEENRTSPTYAQNKDRYGDESTAASDTGAAPDWVVVASDGRYAWHDHRAHWMSREAPVGAERGQLIQDGVIPLQVNGTAVTVTVATTWMTEPSNLPLTAGAVVAGFAVLIVLSIRRRIAWVLVLCAAAAAGIGWWQIESVPAETGPSSIWWLLPAVAGASAIIAIVLGRSLVSHALVVLGGMQLVLWVYLRRDGLVKSLLPTGAPFWLDRGVTSAAAVGGAVAIGASALAMFRLEVPSTDGARASRQRS